MSNPNPAIYTECTPIDIDGQDMTEAVILSDLNNRDKDSVTTTVLHFFVFIICIIFSGILTPVFFNLIKDNSGILVKSDNNEETTLSVGVQIVIILLFLGYAIAMATLSNNIIQTTVGSFMFIYVFVSSSIMYFLKTIYPTHYALDLNTNAKMGGTNKLYGGILFSGIIVGLTYLIKSSDKKNKKNEKNKNDGSMSILIPYGILIAFIISFLFIPNSETESNGTSGLSSLFSKVVSGVSSATALASATANKAASSSRAALSNGVGKATTSSRAALSKVSTGINNIRKGNNKIIPGN